MNRKMLSFSQNSHRAASLRGLSLSSLVLGLAASALASDATSKPTVSLNQVAPPVIASAQYLGRLASSTKLKLSLSLEPANRSAFEAYADSVADRNSPNYRKYLTPKQIGERFGASATTVNTTVAFLKGKGLKVTMIADNRMAILFEGTAAQAESAFATQLGTYRAPDLVTKTPINFFAYQSKPKAPSAIASKVIYIGGLENFYRPRQKSTLTPTQTRTLYNAAPLYDANGLNRKGEGINIGVTNFDGYRLSNLPLLYSTFNLAVPAGGVGSNIRKISVDGSNGEVWAPGAEGDLDIQLVLAMAPRCTLYIYDATNFVALAARQAQDNVVDIITESYGHYSGPDAAPSIQAAHDQHVAMSAQGITYMLATGDYGTDLTAGSGRPFDYPNFDPEILQIGGTVATVDSAGRRIREDGWDGSGSGWSTFNISFNRLPDWQRGATVPTNVNRRLFPDISLHAAGANDLSSQAYNFVFNGQVSAVSGTSASSPTFAGHLGLILQELVANGGLEVDPSSGRPRLGPIQKDYIYPLWDGRSDIFLDILTGNAGVLPDGTQSVGKVGWDYVTGYGAPDIQGMLNAFSEDFIAPLTSEASSAEIYTSSSPQVTYGSLPTGDVTSLSSTDGVSYSILSIKQSGVGQIAATTLDFPLQSTIENRRSVGLKVNLKAERLTTEYVYLLNVTTGKYDVVKTLPATGTFTTVNVSIDTTKYISSDNNVRVLVRALKPTRIGSSAYRLSVDQAVIIERVSNN